MQLSESRPRDHLTSHARKRMRQRAIPPMMIDHVLEFGDCRRARGAESFFFTKKTWRQLAQHAGPAAKHLEHWRNIYVVVAGGSVITAAWRR